VSELKVHIELTRFVQPEKIEIDANERAVNEKSQYCFFVCTTFDSFLNDLFPVLAAKDKFDLEGKKQQAKEYIESLMKPTEAEMDYMERFIAKEYKPELLFEDTEIVERIRNHPMALWKCK
jgi:hypothetical protein